MAWDWTDLHPLAAGEIDLLAADGIPVTPQQVLHLQRLAMESDDDATGGTLAAGDPVEIGETGVTLWPLTICGADWITRNRPDRGAATMYAEAYVMAHPGVTLPEGHAASRAWSAWGRKLKATPQQVTEAVRRVWGQQTLGAEEIQRADDQTAAAGSLGALSAAVCAATGMSPEVVERQMSVVYVQRLLRLAMRTRTPFGVPRDDIEKAEMAMRVKRAALYAERIRKQHGARKG